MAKKSAVENNLRRRAIVDRKVATRRRLKSVIMNKSTSSDDRMMAVYKLSEMTRNSSAVRIRNRCSLTGRARGYYRKFGVSRIALRELSSFGLMPGMKKASW